MCFKIDRAILIFGSKFTVFALFYLTFVIEGNFPSTSPRGAYVWRGDLTEGFLRYRFWGAYIWRGLYTEGLIFRILRYCFVRRLFSPVSSFNLVFINSYIFYFLFNERWLF